MLTQYMSLALILQACRGKGVQCIVAPYEADAQLCYLMKSGITQVTITEDSDLLVYGCQKVGPLYPHTCAHALVVIVSSRLCLWVNAFIASRATVSSGGILVGVSSLL